MSERVLYLIFFCCLFKAANELNRQTRYIDIQLENEFVLVNHMTGANCQLTGS